MESNKRNIGTGFILAIVLGIIIIAGGAYYLGNKNSKQEVKNPENILPSGEEQNLPIAENPQTAQVSTECVSTSQPFIKVISPNGGEMFTEGDKITIKWESCNVSSDTKDLFIALHQNGEWKNVIYLDNATLNDGNESLAISSDVVSGSYKIRVGSPAARILQDFSDNLFTINSKTKKFLEGYVSYSGKVPYTFTYPPSIFKPDYYVNENGSKVLSIESVPNSILDGCDMLSISTIEYNKIPTCTEETNRYTPGVMNYCKTIVGSATKTTYKVNASTPQVCSKPVSQVARNFVDHLISELAVQ